MRFGNGLRVASPVTKKSSFSGARCHPSYSMIVNTKFLISIFYAETCYPPWTELKKRCYLVTEAQVQRWKDVPGQCLKLNSLMVAISSEEENEFVHQLAQVLASSKVLKVITTNVLGEREIDLN